MAIRSPPRLCWAPDDSGLVSYRNRLVQLHDASGKARRELASERIYDVRFRDDGRIIVLDDRGSLTFKRDGELIEQTHFRIDMADSPEAASMSDNGERYVAVGRREIFAVALGKKPERIWTLHAASYGVALGDRRPMFSTNLGNTNRIGIEMSPDGRLVAIGYSDTGRAWIVIELATDQFLQRASSQLDTPKNAPRAAAPLLFAFDGEGKRLAIAAPDQGTSWGVANLESSERELRRDVPGGRRDRWGWASRRVRICQATGRCARSIADRLPLACRVGGCDRSDRGFAVDRARASRCRRARVFTR
ncbi:MAG: hypothetical protein QM831_00180 [Kofleriaceae bacterium]